MHRRITTVVQFSPPDYHMRLRIWESLLERQFDNSSQPAPSDTPTQSDGTPPLNGVTCVPKRAPPRRLKAASNINLPALAIKYELTGGFIKNALLSALLSALHRHKYESSPELRSSDEPVCLTQTDLEDGCRLQMRGSLSLKHQDTKVFPSISSFIFFPPLRTVSPIFILFLAAGGP